MRIRVDSYNAPEGRRHKVKESEVPAIAVTASTEWFDISPGDADLLEQLLHKHFGDHYQVVHELNLTEVTDMLKQKKRGRKK